MDVTKFQKVLSTVKYVYTLLYLTLFSVFYNSYVHAYAYEATQLLYQILVFAGILILVADFFTSGVFLKSKYSTVLVLFYLACAVSIAVNLSYDVVGNLKVVAWMMIQTFVFASMDKEQSREHHLKWFRYVTESFSFVWFVGAVWSFCLFLFGFGRTVVNPDSTAATTRVGFVEGRLFGVFRDPNYAALCILFSMLMILCNMFLHKEKLPAKIYHVLLLVFDFIYVLLSRSRTAVICIVTGVAVASLFLAARFFLTRKDLSFVKRWGATLLAVVAATTVGFYATELSNDGLDRLYVAMGTYHNIGETSTQENQKDLSKEELLEELVRPDVDLDNIASSGSRSKIWSDYFQVFLKKPVFGTGPRNALTFCEEWFPDSFVAQRDYSVHNGYLSLLVSTGVVGTAVMAVFLFLVVKDVLSYLIRRIKKEDELYVPIVILTVLLYIGAISAFPMIAVFFSNSACDAIFWFALGYTLMLIRLSGFFFDEKPGLVYRLTSFLRPKNKRQ